MTGETGITKIDIFTTTGLTLSDGSILDAGAVIKFSTEFPIGFDGYRFDIEPYRSLEIYKAGYRPVEIVGLETRGEIQLSDMSTVNMVEIYNGVNNYINAQFPYLVTEVVIYQE